MKTVEIQGRVFDLIHDEGSCSECDVTYVDKTCMEVEDEW
jgi:hypothetical protein